MASAVTSAEGGNGDGDGSSIEDIWKSLKALDSCAHEEYKKRSQSRPESELLIPLEEKISRKKTGATARSKSEKKGKKKDKERGGHGPGPSDQSGEVMDSSKTAEGQPLEVTAVTREKVEITAQEYLQKIARDLNLLESSNLKERKRSIESILTQLSEEFSLSPLQYNDLLSDMARPIFKRFADPVERVRDQAFKLTRFLFQNASDFVPVLGYYLPALLQRIPTTLAYDQDLQVPPPLSSSHPLQIFVTDIETHQAYKRGRAVERQDKKDLMAPVSVIETSEEIRLLMCQSLSTLCHRLTELRALSVLNPYFSDVILYLQAQVRDPFPDVKVEALRQIELFAKQAEYEHGMCYFSVALCRCILPHLRHRHAKVRAAAVDAYRACVHIPNREKRKGAGTETIAELIGFREENVLPVAAFYQSEVSINYLAELSSDPSAVVRERVALMLSSFLTELEDRYDHQTRLLPYLLDLLGDELSSIAQIALTCLSTCGSQYEAEHPDDIIEKRQYGIDGDERCNFEKPLPFPFTQRPRIGIRLYVRGNTKRFLFSLINELTNWQSKTRIQSAKLLKYLIVLCEEHLTMEAHKLIPTFIKALTFAREDTSRDKELEELMCEICELSGRYLAPEAYVHYILPRLRGDAEVIQFGVDSLTRCCVMDTLRCMIDGSKSNLLSPLFPELVSCLIDPYVIDIASLSVHQTALQLLNTLLSKIQGKGLTAIEAHFQSTGRLKSLKQSIADAFRFLFLALHQDELRSLASTGLISLSALDYDTRATGVPGLISRHMQHLLLEITTSETIEEPTSHEFHLLKLFILCPWFFIQSNFSIFRGVVDYLISAISHLQSSPHSLSTFSTITIVSTPEVDHLHATPLNEYVNLLLATLAPVFSFTVSLSKYYVDLYSPPRSPQDTEVITTAQCLRPCRLEDFGGTILKFLISSPWKATHTLQSGRLDLISLLLCQHLLSGEDHVEREVTLTFVKDLLATHSEALLTQVFSPTALPSCPFPIRQKSIHLLSHAIRCSSSPDARIIPYSLMSTPTSCIPTTVIDLLFEHLTSVCLNDGSDDIRLPALEAMLQLIPFLKREQDSSSPSASFDGLVNCLFTHSLVGNPTEEVITHLDLLLRSIAILDPFAFESLVRSKFSSLSPTQQASSSISGFFSGLIDHADVLIQFQQLKLSK